MKKIKTALAAIAMLLVTTAFAKDPEKVTASVQAAFQQDFSSASGVTWKVNSDFYFATFLLNGISVDAAYNADGELLGTSRTISIGQVPLAVTMELAKRYNGFGVSAKAIELNFEGQTSYYIDVQDNELKLSLKCSSNGDISVDRRTKKNNIKS